MRGELRDLHRDRRLVHDARRRRMGTGVEYILICINVEIFAFLSSRNLYALSKLYFVILGDYCRFYKNEKLIPDYSFIGVLHVVGDHGQLRRNRGLLLCLQRRRTWREWLCYVVMKSVGNLYKFSARKNK